MIYKIISKALVNRLKNVLPDIISEEQSTFVPERIITDNVLVAYECLHYMRTNRSKSNAFCALKLDMTKAYDRVEWKYLEAVMLKLGFNQTWVNKIMKCVTKVSWCYLMVKNFKSSSQLEESDKGTIFLHICSYFVQKVFHVCSRQKERREIFKVSKSHIQLQR